MGHGLELSFLEQQSFSYQDPEHVDEVANRYP
jgi:hypothetical protein